TDPEAQHGFVQAAQDRGYNVLVLDGPLDSHFIGQLEQKLEKTTFKRVDAETTGKLIEKDDAPGDALAVALGREYRDLLGHHPGTRRGVDPEDLHQLRVATRRLRAFLRAAGALVEKEWVVSLREELGWLGGHLGPARDLDVMLDRLRSEVAALGDDGAPAAGLLIALEDEREEAYVDVVEVLGDARYFALLERLERAVAPPLTGDETTLAAIFHREASRMRRKFAALGDDPADDVLHHSRIAVKRARYAADLAAFELGRPGQRFVTIAKQLQDILGDHQDAVFAEARIRTWVASDPAGAFAAGRLVQLERDRKAVARAAWPEMWRRLDEAARRAVR
ncbi:MAG: CHAD domain-containing protein, partial [Thermoleophilia bacterium]|nr:CHAD domain-containing protein [Thermoleophilia bacterium]